ncbi:MAG TPA: AAA family ATPase, partial [Polyangiaceae bacterium]
LTDEFGAPLEVASRLAVIRGSGREDGELDLREHLYDAFGVSELRRAATAATQLHKEAVAARKKLRSSSRSLLANRDQLTQLASSLADDIGRLSAKRTNLTDHIRAARLDQQTSAAWTAYEAAVEAQQQHIDAILAREASLAAQATTLEDLSGLVNGQLEALNLTSTEATQILVEARAQHFAARSALSLLEGHDPECPTCARPFHGDELRHSITAQLESLALAEGRIEQAQQDLTAADSEIGRLARLRDEIGALSAPILRPVVPMPPDDREATLAAAENALREHDELVGGISQERAVAIEQLANDDDVRAAVSAERIAWHREALTQATAAALTATAERVAEEHIEPLSERVRWRWKALFGEDGLQLRPDGTIVRVVGTRELPWQQLSSGEQIWARLVASMLILQSSTTLPFAWLDEPLEHLDPRARRIVAMDLATSTKSGRPLQLIVTTYEHAIARQLSEDLATASMLRINRTEVLALPPRPGDQSTQTDALVSGNSGLSESA